MLPPETITTPSSFRPVVQASASLKSSSSSNSPMPGRRSDVGVAFGVGKGLAVGVGGNHWMVGVELGAGVGVSLGAAGAKVTRQPELASKSRADANVRMMRLNTTGYYSDWQAHVITDRVIITCHFERGEKSV